VKEKVQDEVRDYRPTSVGNCQGKGAGRGKGISITVSEIRIPIFRV
jgi:hypothetical protein